MVLIDKFEIGDVVVDSLETYYLVMKIPKSFDTEDLSTLIDDKYLVLELALRPIEVTKQKGLWKLSPPIENREVNLYEKVNHVDINPDTNWETVLTKHPRLLQYVVAKR